jgi:hypothetical protein
MKLVSYAEEEELFISVSKGFQSILNSLGPSSQTVLTITSKHRRQLQSLRASFSLVTYGYDTQQLSDTLSALSSLNSEHSFVMVRTLLGLPAQHIYV